MNNKPESKSLNESGQDTLVPQLRFSAFKDTKEWTKVQLDEITIPVLDRVVQGEAYPVISFTAEYGLVKQEEPFEKKASSETLKRYFKVSRDDFIFNEGASRGAICGSIKRLSNLSEGMVSPVYKCFRCNTNEVPAFWAYYFESEAFKVQLSNLIDGESRGGRFNLSIQRLLSVYVWRPCESEQRKIADCFTILDELIGAQTRKITALKTQRKALMLKLFVWGDEGKPHLRFSRFQDDVDWKRYLFGDVFRITVGKEFKASEYSSSGVCLLQSKSVESGTIRWAKNSIFLPSTYEDEFPDLVVRSGDIALALSNPLVDGDLRMARVEEGMPISILNQKVGRLGIVSDLVCIDFAFQYCQQFIRDFLMKDIAGKAYSLISLKGLKLQRVFLPSLSEQKRISQCISSLDDLIVMHTKKLEKLNTHKEALMQKLFPGLNGGDA